MEKWIKNVLSFMVIVFFGYLAIACTDGFDPPIPGGCLDPLLYEKEPLDNPIGPVIYYSLTLLDKETNQPVSGIYVKAYWNIAFCDEFAPCPLKCLMLTPRSIDDNTAEHFTNANGNIDGQTFPFEFLDKKDKVLVTFDVEDTHGVYVAKRISFRYDYTNNSQSYTAYLLKNDAL
ncbi:MAG: hypothetical protein IPN79_06135 [Saprospiraceae bacterium]|nr:hypothetical protein [Saprospiraceae bacterium]